ncbi:MAG: diaminopimelate decarboxylase [Bacteroidales bacterium]|nr:diaminopimelate decarboxylase [Bacteroidales bacterium]
MLDINTIEKLDKIATPFYYYDMDLFRRTVDTASELAQQHNIMVHYAVKANVERRLLEYISSKGFGADCVSGNEVLHAHECGFPAGKIVYAGVGKSDKEIYNALKLGIEAFNCESLQEIYVINEMAHVHGLKANVSVRINPDIDAHTHKYVTTGLYENKFGISQHEFDKLIDILKKSEHINFIGLHFHIGSQITRVDEVFALECRRVNEIVAYFERNGLTVSNINLGGGLGVDYDDPDENPIADFGTWFRTISENIVRRDDQKVHVEPGRSLVAQCGTLMSRVLFVKSGETKNFLIMDAGMNDLIRPALYGAYHKIENLSASQRTFYPTHQAYDIVGPVCESSDVWGAGRLLPLSVRGDLMAIRSTGAYGQVMASRYNMKDLAPSVFSDSLEDAAEAVDYFTLSSRA